ncbi:hypothetical protein NC651_033890 [Populus alba x Populus x berolinensis]|nr:hypothetical protein NC651_033890 [Populus alba x Populus x berolinensis]
MQNTTLFVIPSSIFWAPARSLSAVVAKLYRFVTATGLAPNSVQFFPWGKKRKSFSCIPCRKYLIETWSSLCMICCSH